MTMDPYKSGMNPDDARAPFSASAYPAPPSRVQSPFPAPPDIPADEPVLSRMYDILTHPTNIPHYMAHLRGAKWSTIIWLTLGLGLFESVITALGANISASNIGNIPGFSQLPSSGQTSVEAMARLSGSHGNLLTVVVGFFLGSGIYWLLAKLLGGQGSFLQTAWLIALISTPIAAAETLLGLIPVVGLVVAVVLGIYQVVMMIFAMAAAHRLKVGRATTAVLIPLALGLVAITCALGAMAALLVGNLGH